ncbi:protoheme IX farnesyltransferase [Coraliomargarita sinensis]|uniref:Protoheme IX farnesyltransferase n=2 Tax=Coraliomargarita sinensis TaxID=2174842 RepID=A0A317ZFW6_9BACT|nr:protoheme IX farnesyltransferase [Coraliomargarita sinensis]
MSLSRWAPLAAYWELTKPRLSMMAVITALLGYLAASSGDALTLIAVFAGTALAAGGAAALNQWWERDEDALMHRTADRPLPMRKLSPQATFIFGAVLCLLGPAVLWFGGNALSGVLTAVTVVTYVLLYTPLKKVTPWSTEIGAIPGALPPLIGWVAAEGSIGWVGLFLFAVLYVWQLPHFMAISWLYREDYERSGFRMLSLYDKTGRVVSLRAVIWAVPLLVLTVLAWLTNESGWLFLVGGSLLSFGYLREAVRMLTATERDKPARRLFLASIIFLPCYLILMVADRILFSL